MNASGAYGFTSLSMNGIVTKTGQKLDISNCAKLDTIDIKYYFKNTTDELIIDASDNSQNIKDGDKENFKVSYSEGSANGKYKLCCLDGSPLYTLLTNYHADYSNVTLVTSNSSSIKDIVFEQDLYWYRIGGRSKIRDYEANPIKLKVGDTIKDNSVFLYSEKGLITRDVSYTYSVVKNLETNETPDIFTVDNNEKKLKITADKPGVAYLTVAANYYGAV